MEARELPQVVGGGWDEAWIQIQTKGGSLRTILLLICIHTLQRPRRSCYSQKGRGGPFRLPGPLKDKAVAHQILGAELPCLPTCISHKRPTLIIYFFSITLSLAESFCEGTGGT